MFDLLFTVRTMFDSVTAPDFNETFENNKVLCMVHENNNIFW